MAAPADRITDASGLAHDLELSAEAVVVGTGAGGAVVARELAEAGLDVVVLEEGPLVTASDYGSLGPIDATRLLYRDQGLTASRGSPPVMMPMGRCVGGTTVINLGTILRMREEHFERWRDAGLRRISWQDLTRAYDRVEEVLPVEPVPPEGIGPNTRILMEGAARVGLPGGEVLTRSVRGCASSARCFLGCPTNAKKALHLNYVPLALERGARLLTRCRARRIVASDGTVSGVEASAVGPRGSAGRRVRVGAPIVVVACGALLSPVLLAASGLDGGHPAAGFHLGVHPACRAIGLHDEPVHGDEGVPQAYHVPLTDPGEMVVETVFLPPALMALALPGLGRDHVELMRRYDHLSLLGFRIIETQRGSVRGSLGGMPRIHYDLGPRDLATILAGLRLSARMLLATGARRVFVPVRGMEVLERGDHAALLDDPRIRAADLELSGYHAHGTLRMGSDPKASVVDEDGAVRGVRGLYVADASLFPTSSRVNPQLTVMALATLVAEAIRRGARA